MMLLFVRGQLAALPECLPTRLTLVGFYSGVSMFVLLQILEQIEGLFAIFALELLFGVVFLVVPLQAKLTLEDLLAVEDVTLKAQLWRTFRAEAGR